ncbi:MAG: hypothetical protein ACE3L7_14920 [Candidatus Pristimantibacillus sp.]
MSTQVAFASNNQSVIGAGDIVSAKKAFVEAHKLSSAKRVVLSELELEERQQNILNTLNKVVAGDLPKTETMENLEGMGVFEFIDPSDEEQIITPYAAQPGDIVVNQATIVWDQFTSQWYVAAGGGWKNNNFSEHAPSFSAPTVGQVKNVGNLDLVGFGFYNVSGNYGPVAMQGAVAYLSDGEGWTYNSSSLNHGDGQFGVAFDIQDQVKIKTVNYLTGLILIPI